MKFNFVLKKVKFVLLMIALIFTVVAAFMPYSVELMLGLSATSLVGYAVCTALGKDDLRWFPAVIAAGISVSVIMTLVLMIGHKLGLYTVIEFLNLLIIALSAVREILRKSGGKWPFVVISAICLIFTAVGAYSHIAYGRTIMATLAEWRLASQKVHDRDVTATFKALTEEGETSFSVDSSAFDKKLEEKTYEGMPVLYANSDADYDHVIFYIHGGYYVYQMSNEQMIMMNRLANTTNSMVVMPVYPLAPFNTVEDSYDIMMGLYEQVCRDNEGKKIILIGDSAGGGYSLALAEGLTERGLSQPDELVLLSPWVDVTMSNPDIADYVDVEPMLTTTMGKMSGEAWAGELPVDDWHVSPIYGNLSELKNVTIFVGTRELFYPDDTHLYEKLSGNPNVKLYVVNGLNHVYPAYPILEGRIAVDQIRELILR